jgi:hypothetical protein
MNVKLMDSGAIIVTGLSIDKFRLASLRGMLRMEKAGMKTRGGAIRPRICVELGLKRNDSFDTFIDKINELLAAS